MPLTKSDLIERIAARQDQLPPRDVEMAIKMIMEEMARALINNRRIEIRGFGSFCLHYRAPRLGRNPKLAAPWSCRENGFPISNLARNSASV